MTHVTIEDLLAARDGEGTPTTLEHLAHCPVCQGELATLRRFREELEELPALLPPPEGWERLTARLREAERQRWMIRGGWAAAGVMALFTVAVAVQGGLEAWQELKQARQIQALIQRSQELEAQLRDAQPNGRVMTGGVALSVAELQRRLEEVDAELAEARRGVRPARELAGLWRERVRVLEELLETASPRAVLLGL